MAVASWRVVGWLPTSIFTAEAPSAYLGRALPLAEIYVPFVDETNVAWLVSKSLAQNDIGKDGLGGVDGG
jgi:hypothetical protein